MSASLPSLPSMHSAQSNTQASSTRSLFSAAAAMSAAVAIRTDAADFVEQGVSPLCSEGAPPDADPNFIYTAARVERVALVDHDFDETIAGGVYFWPTRRIVRKGIHPAPNAPRRATNAPLPAPHVVAGGPRRAAVPSG